MRTHEVGDATKTAELQAESHERWKVICARIQALKGLDTRFVVPGAQAHRYAFKPCLSREEIAAHEARLGVALPTELTFVYTNLGDGGAGPDDGLASAASLSVWDPGREFEGDETLTRKLTEAGVDLASARLVEIMSCLWESAAMCRLLLVCGGPRDGAVMALFVGADFGIYPYYESLAELYSRWLDHRLAVFRFFESMVRASDDIQEIWERRNELAGSDWLSVDSELDILYDYNTERGFELWDGTGYFLVLESVLGEDCVDEDDRPDPQEEHCFTDETRARCREAIGRYRARTARHA
jgi:hypothetical protein